ncbi:MAG: hypothetical protein MUF54_14585 [Polyangiaceae bacterium]|nr:hypothetical protein [Polyangiaceae bacterium]
MAKLAFRATKIESHRPQYLDSTQHPNWLGLNVVQVHEIDTPEGQDEVSCGRKRCDP